MIQSLMIASISIGVIAALGGVYLILSGHRMRNAAVASGLFTTPTASEDYIQGDNRVFNGILVATIIVSIAFLFAYSITHPQPSNTMFSISGQIVGFGFLLCASDKLFSIDRINVEANKLPDLGGKPERMREPLRRVMRLCLIFAVVSPFATILAGIIMSYIFPVVG